MIWKRNKEFPARAAGVLLGILLLPAGTGWGQTRIKVSGEYAPQLTVAVVDFEPREGSERDRGTEMADLLLGNLLITGSFTPVADPQFIADAQAVDRRTGKVNLAEWRAIGADVVVKGSLSVAGEIVTVECRAVSVSQGRQVYSRGYRDAKFRWRKIIMTMADEIVFALTGERGLSRTEIAFTSTRDGEKKIYRMEASGNNWRQINSGRGLALYPAWTPDGRALAYTGYPYGFPWIFLDNLATAKRRVLSAQPGLNAFPAISPDGRWVAFSLSRDGNTEIYKMRMDGSQLTRLTNHQANDCSPAWSPDGRRIAFTSDRSGSPQIYVLEADGIERNVRRLTRQGGYNTSPDWSPRGSLIAYTSRLEGNFEICTVNVDTDEVARLTKSQSQDEDPSWAPNGRHLVYSSRQGRQTNLFILDSLNPRPVQITSGTDCYSPAWSPFLTR
jgi:TolB protein